MFTLRKVVDNVETNQNLGNEYQVIHRDIAYEKFREAYQLCFGEPHYADSDDKATRFSKNCYAIIVHKNGSELIPLYIGQYNYIMSDTGKTFDNLTHR